MSNFINTGIKEDELTPTAKENVCPRCGCGNTEFYLKGDGTYIDVEYRMAYEDMECTKCHLLFIQWYEVGVVFEQVIPTPKGIDITVKAETNQRVIKGVKP